MASPDNKLNINCDNDIWLSRVSIFRTSAPTTAGSGSFTLQDESGTTISTGAVSYSTANSSEAHWFGRITSTMVTSTIVTAGNFYTLVVNLINSTGPNDERRIKLLAGFRGST